MGRKQKSISRSPNDDFFNSIWKKSLESFLIGHLIYHAQIDDFKSSDLIAIIKSSCILIVFDGFDEIADIMVRKEVIDFINAGINRLSENSKSLQVVVTSRPAAFSDSIGFSIDQYPHFELTDITIQTTKEYVEKWIKASRLDSREASEIKRLVDEKLKMPHLRDLAKSPMQLAIFISLLRTRGESLPNKRTALYDSYIELFFNRESEKNSTIRDHRDLIIDIHQYLAWLLHSEAEFLKNNGSIHINDLKDRLKEYLIKEGHRTDIADKLFHVMQERVCALVSRVQGTYEFEVQPLREYFCAKFLYNTSPYSPTGSEKKGTTPDRFEAISRNFYWHNIVRFFAGCFSKGELPMLIQKLKELQEDEILKYTNYPRLITSQILSDWVFTQYPLLLDDVVKLIINGINIGNILNQEERYVQGEPIVLPVECGRGEIVKECFEQLSNFPHRDYAYELIGIINNNTYDILEFWMKYLPKIEEDKITIWLEYAYMLEIVHRIDESILLEIIMNSSPNLQFKQLQILLNGNRHEMIEKNKYLKELTYLAVIEEKVIVRSRTTHSSSLQFLSFIHNKSILVNILTFDSADSTFIDNLNYRIHRHSMNKVGAFSILNFDENDTIDRSIRLFCADIEYALHKTIQEWKTNLDIWDLFIEKYKNYFNNEWSAVTIAVISAGVKSKLEISEDYRDLHQDTKSLCRRVRYARLKSGNISYWEALLADSKNNLFVLLVFFTWATPKSIISLVEKLTEVLSNISDPEFAILYNTLKITSRLNFIKSSQLPEFYSKLDLDSLSDEMKVILSNRLEEDDRNIYLYKNINSNNIRSVEISGIRLEFLIGRYLNNTDDEYLLDEIKSLYSYVPALIDRHLFYRNPRHELVPIPIELAKKIMSNSKQYPRVIASLAEKSCRIYANNHIVPVGKIAKEENWFN